jgi:DnaJ-domain-containing protein 1
MRRKETKKCRGPCGEELPIDEFSIQRNGRQSRCKTCRRNTERLRNKDRHIKKTITDVCKSVVAGTLYHAGTRALHHGLKTVIEQQLLLAHAPKAATPSGKHKVRKVVEDTLVEISQAFSRCSSRINTVIHSEKELLDLEDAGDREALRILELEEGASEEEIKKAYREKAKTLHPDVSGDRKGSHEAMQLLNDAYGTLSKKGTNGQTGTQEVDNRNQEGPDSAEQEEGPSDNVF